MLCVCGQALAIGTGDPGSQSEELFFFKNSANELSYSKRDLRPAAHGGVMLLNGLN